jgi:hypothetical protein
VSIIPARLDEIVAKALEKDRALRYLSAAELRADLQRLKRDTESAAVAPTAARPNRARVKAGSSSCCHPAMRCN